MLPEKNIEMVNEYFSKADSVSEYNERVKRGLLQWEKAVLNGYMMPLGSVLDVGCGCGREAFELYDLGYKITAVDLSAQQIEQAKKNAIQNGKNVDFRVCDGLHYDFEDDFFDYVIIWQQVLGNVPTHTNRINVLKEAKRVLKAHGKLVVSVHNYENCLPIAEKKDMIVSKGEEERDFILKDNDSTCYWHYFTKNEFEQHFIEAGLKIIFCDYATAFGMVDGWNTVMVCIAEKI